MIGKDTGFLSIQRIFINQNLSVTFHLNCCKKCNSSLSNKFYSLCTLTLYRLFTLWTNLRNYYATWLSKSLISRSKSHQRITGPLPDGSLAGWKHRWKNVSQNWNLLRIQPKWQKQNYSNHIIKYCKHYIRTVWSLLITFNVLPISGVRNTDLMNSLHLICLVHGLEVRRPEMVVLWMLVGPTAVGVHAWVLYFLHENRQPLFWLPTINEV